MSRTTRLGGEILIAGLIGWLLFLAVAAWAPAGAIAVDPTVGYPADWNFVAAVALRSLSLLGAVALVAWIAVRRDQPWGRAICALALMVLTAAWATRAGIAAGDLGRSADPLALARATGPHTVLELGLILSPLVAGARGLAPRWPWLAAAAAGLLLAATVEAFV